MPLSLSANDKLFKENAISAAEFDAARSTYDVAKAEVTAAEQNVKAAEYSVKSAEASVKEASDNLYKTSIYAPVSGTISKLNVEKGSNLLRINIGNLSNGFYILDVRNSWNQVFVEKFVIIK
ncbi:hypothetical protein EOM81_13205 [bacterium]|nr:hypothetical protein [bacterium]